MGSDDAPTTALILVVEDNAANLILMRALLRRAGYRLAEARSLAEARECLGSMRPDAVVLDLGLGDGNGLDLLRDLRGRAIPALAVSAYAMAAERDRALNAGCAGYLTKPLDTRAFAAQLAEVLRQARRAPQGG